MGVLGNHCNVGGCYDNGLGALYLEGATGFLQKSGLGIADVDILRSFDPTARLSIYDETTSVNSNGTITHLWKIIGVRVNLNC